MIATYIQERKLRKADHLPPLPMTESQTDTLLKFLDRDDCEEPEQLIYLLENWVEPGVSSSAKSKASWLHKVAAGWVENRHLSSERAVEMLGQMIGGYCVPALIDLLSNPDCAKLAAGALKRMTRVYDHFAEVAALASKNKYAAGVLESWARAEWFSSCPDLPEDLELTVYKVEGEITTDDLSPGNEAQSRTDIPLHATHFGRSRFSGGLGKIRQIRDLGKRVAFAGDVVGTGSSRKSAVNSLSYIIGDDIPYVPNKRRGGIFLASTIAPIFYSSARDAGLLPIECDAASLQTGDVIIFRPADWSITTRSGKNIHLEPPPPTLRDEFKAGGRLSLIIGQELTRAACTKTGIDYPTFFSEVPQPVVKTGQGYTLAQKMVGRACGKEGVLPKEMCLVKTSTVGSQDTTGPMTMQEVEELACLKFKTDLFLQTFCHTAAYPRKSDLEKWQQLTARTVSRGGIPLKPGDGVIHSWLNKMLVPDTVGTGGDSHTRFPLGISFPAGSGLVAFAAALGFMPLEMPESVLVRFKGERKSGITVRDMVNAIPYFAQQNGLLTIDKVGKKNVFAGRVIEIEGVDDLTVDEAFELSDATAERNGAACTLQLPVKTVEGQIKENIQHLQTMVAEGYEGKEALQNRIEELQKWLEKPALLCRDDHCDFTEVLEIDLAEIAQPLLACPNDPDDVKPLDKVKGTEIDEVFIGSCMIHRSHLHRATALLEGKGYCRSRMWVAPTTRMDNEMLLQQGAHSIMAGAGCRIEKAGCSLCMGNQARVQPGATVFSTSTRNFDNRLGDGAKVFLGSTELAVISGLKGALPTVDEYFSLVRRIGDRPRF